MAYFEDLSTYSYSDVEVIEMDWGWLRFRPRYDRINIGWLDASHPFKEGPAPAWFANALLDIIAASRVNTMRGYHQCSFCPEASGVEGGCRPASSRTGAESASASAAPRVRDAQL